MSLLLKYASILLGFWIFMQSTHDKFMEIIVIAYMFFFPLDRIIPAH